MNGQYGLDLAHLGPPIIAVYVAADFGSIGGGWLSSRLLSKGWTVNQARKTAMLLCAVCVLPVSGLMFARNHLWVAVALIGLAAAAHQGWSANLYTLVSDSFPRTAVGSVVGLGGLGGAIGGMLVAPAIGYWLDFSHKSYGPIFFIAGSAYLFALAIVHWLVPKIKQVDL